MTEKGVFQPEKIHMTEFKLLKEQVESSFGFDLKKVDGFSLNVSFEMGFNLEENLTKADLNVDIVTVNKEEQEEQQEQAKASFHLAFVYTVDNLDELVKTTEKKNELEVDDALANSIASLSYSTARGILMSRVQNTVFKKFILPVINPNDLLNH
jgi:hypothetical protein